MTYLTNGLDQRTSKSGPTAVVPSGQIVYAYDEAGKQIGEYNSNGNPPFSTGRRSRVVAGLHLTASVR